MSTRIILLAVAILALAIMPASASQWDLLTIDLSIGTTASGAAANSGIVRIPQDAQIVSVHITESINVGANADGLAVGLFKNNASLGGISSSTALVANTPQAVTPSSYNLSAGDILQARATKTGVGTVTADLTVTVGYFSTTSRR